MPRPKEHGSLPLVTQQDKLTRGAGGRPTHQFFQRLAGFRPDKIIVVATLVEPVANLGNLQISNRPEVRQRLALNQRGMDAHHQHASQRHGAEQDGCNQDHARPLERWRRGNISRKRFVPSPGAKNRVEERTGHQHERPALEHLDPSLQEGIVDAHRQQRTGRQDPDHRQRRVKQSHAPR